MRFLHTSDWHLGRLFHGVHLTDDQAHVLGQLVDLARNAKVDAVVVAGDLYDRQVPPPEAVALLGDTFERITVDLRIPVLAIAGNHDSPERLSFGARLFAENRLHLAGTLPGTVRPVILRDRHGPVEFFPVPYAEPSVVRQATGREGIADHQGALQALVEGIAATRTPGTRSVLIAHAFVAGGEESPDSERPLSVGGAGTVDAATLRGFSYVALGHLHRPQPVGDDAFRYSGSLLKYSFAEALHQKSVAIVEVDAAGACSVETVPLSPRRDVRRVEGTLQEVLARGEKDPCREDYLEVSILGRDAILDAISQLRSVYPNVLSLRRPDLERVGELIAGRIDLERVTEADLFGTFFKQVTGEDLSGDQAAALRSVLEAMKLQEREVSA